jgi:Amt family ammonium transporter
MGWILVEWIRNGKPTLVGASSGAVAGLVAITPACAFITPWSAILLGLVAGVLCSLAVGLKYLFKVDDSLDVFGIHFVGGWIGCLWIGFFATSESGWVYAPDEGGIGHVGLLYGGGSTQLMAQLQGAAVVTVWSFVVAIVLGYVLKLVGLLKVKEEHQDELDLHQHKESAYESALSETGYAGVGAHAVEKPSQPAGV